MKTLASNFVEFLVEKGVYKMVDGKLYRAEGHTGINSISCDYRYKDIYDDCGVLFVYRLTEGIECNFVIDKTHEECVDKLMDEFYHERVNEFCIEFNRRFCPLGDEHIAISYIMTKKEI